jgi:LPXTG-site transpeptidase (sortase) family protein
MSIKKLIAINLFFWTTAVYFIIFIIKPNLISLPKPNLTTKLVQNLRPSPTPTPTPTPTPIPQRITIPKINLTADVVEIGLAQDGQEMDVPTDTMQVGWYEYGPSPGASGSAVLTAHYDTPTGQAAIFSNLKKLEKGDEIVIQNDQSQMLTFRVTEVAEFPLSTFPKDLIYSKKPWPQISLVTCSGIWNQATQLYTHRLAVVGKLEKVAKLEYIADQNSPQQYLQELEKEIAYKKIADSAYLRIDNKSIYLSTNNNDVTIVEIVFENAQNINKQNNPLTNKFKVHHWQTNAQNQTVLTLFTDPQKHFMLPVNTQSGEIKIAEFSSTNPINLQIDKQNSQIILYNNKKDIRLGEKLVFEVL